MCFEYAPCGLQITTFERDGFIAIILCAIDIFYYKPFFVFYQVFNLFHFCKTCCFIVINDTLSHTSLHVRKVTLRCYPMRPAATGSVRKLSVIVSWMFAFVPFCHYLLLYAKTPPEQGFHTVFFMERGLEGDTKTAIHTSNHTHFTISYRYFPLLFCFRTTFSLNAMIFRHTQQTIATLKAKLEDRGALCLRLFENNA